MDFRLYGLYNYHMENIKQQEKKETLPEYLQMYEISGQDPITEHSFERYQKNKEENEEIIKDLAEGRHTFDVRKIPEFSSEKEKVEFIEHGLASGNPDVEENCAEMIKDVKDEKDKNFLREKLYKLIHNLEEYHYVPLIDDVAEDKQPALREEVARLIDVNLSGKKKPKIQRVFARIIPYASKEKQEALRKKAGLILSVAFASGDDWQIKERLELLEYVPEDKLAHFIKMGFESENPMIRFRCLRHLENRVTEPEERRLIEEEVENFMNVGFASGEKRRVEESIAMNRFAPKESRKEFFEMAKNKLGNSLVESPLYKKKEVLDEHFSRQEFEKTGSGLTLLGGELKDNTIIRHIEPEAFLSWQKLYEDHELWKNAGFDYVPIEPIQSFKVNKDDLVDVYSGVLDLSYAWWTQISAGSFSDELQKDHDSILKVLKEQKVDHGHTHEQNFCLRFFRDENGNVDFNKKPRMYLIDFDQAVS